MAAIKGTRGHGTRSLLWQQQQWLVWAVVVLQWFTCRLYLKHIAA